ncbi:MAG: hypothetical protein ABFC89_09080 [Methanospirillum sp.]
MLFGQEDGTYPVAGFTRMFHGPMTLPDDTAVPPNGRSSRVEFCTVARWKNKEIVVEKLIYDRIP